ncbi:hypothetical protein [Arthrobacter sp. CAN_C5]|uniref:hypothetical protein n=1 Tax=Arthrobacter sp. CAN_C5 TaxID=2760706 RepID=UPI001AE5FFFD|nr:hypothetical protein [Arthrobacter sp. CAN_C5]MBP2218047.1 hypothetical protein [Arthrobacter sp. CAN_C5]
MTPPTFGDITDLVGIVIWLAILLFILFWFREPVRAFILDVREFTSPFISAKRGDMRAQSIAEDVGSPEEVVANGTVGAPDVLSRRVKGREVARVQKGDAELSRFVAEQTLNRLKNMGARTRSINSTESARFVVLSAYTEMLSFIVYLDYVLGADAQSKPGKVQMPSYKLLQNLGAPTEIVEVFRELRTLRMDVNSGKTRVSQQGAYAFIDSASATVRNLNEWSRERL